MNKKFNLFIVIIFAFLVLVNCNNSKESDKLSYLEEVKKARLNNKEANERLKEEVYEFNGYLKEGMTEKAVKKYLEEKGWDTRYQAYIPEYQRWKDKSNNKYDETVYEVYTTYYCKDSLGSASLMVKYIVINYCDYVLKFNCFIGEPKNIRHLVETTDKDKPIVSMKKLREEIAEINNYIQKGMTANEVANFLKSLGWDTLHNVSSVKARSNWIQNNYTKYDSTICDISYCSYFRDDIQRAILSVRYMVRGNKYRKNAKKRFHDIKDVLKEMFDNFYVDKFCCRYGAIKSRKINPHIIDDCN